MKDLDHDKSLLLTCVASSKLFCKKRESRFASEGLCSAAGYTEEKEAPGPWGGSHAAVCAFSSHGSFIMDRAVY